MNARRRPRPPTVHLADAGEPPIRLEDWEQIEFERIVARCRSLDRADRLLRSLRALASFAPWGGVLAATLLSDDADLSHGSPPVSPG